MTSSLLGVRPCETHSQDGKSFDDLSMSESHDWPAGNERQVRQIPRRRTNDMPGADSREFDDRMSNFAGSIRRRKWSSATNECKLLDLTSAPCDEAWSD